MEVEVTNKSEYLTPAALLKSELRAKGEVLTNLDPVPNASAIIIGGNWNCFVKSREIEFIMFCKTMNLLPDINESAPVGSVDQFKVTLSEAYYLDTKLDESSYFCYGKFIVDKFTKLSEGTTRKKNVAYNNLSEMKGWIYINSTYIELDVWPLYIIGSTNSFYGKEKLESV